MSIPSSSTIGSTVLGYPRIGPDRELKRATESYWAGRTDASALRDVAAGLRRDTWTGLRDAGLGSVPGNTFSFYDHVGDTALAVGAVPERFARVTDPLERLRPVTDLRTLRSMIAGVRGLHTAAEVRRYCVEVVGATRRLPEVRLGASPRATLHLLRAARAWAATAGRGYVVPDDVQAVAVPVLAHRLVLGPEGVAARRTPADLVRAAVARVAVPSPPRS